MGFDSPLDRSEVEDEDGVPVVPLSPLSPLSTPSTWKNNMRVQSQSITDVVLQSCMQIQNLPMKLLSKGKCCGQKDGGLGICFLGSSSSHLLLWRRVLALLF